LVIRDPDRIGRHRELARAFAAFDQRDHTVRGCVDPGDGNQQRHQDRIVVTPELAFEALARSTQERLGRVFATVQMAGDIPDGQIVHEAKDQGRDVDMRPIDDPALDVGPGSGGRPDDPDRCEQGHDERQREATREC